MRAAAATAIAFLACHPIGAKGDECMWGPYRETLLEAGALRVLLEAALAPTQDEVCRKVIEKAAAVGVMYLCTVVSLPSAANCFLCAYKGAGRTCITVCFAALCCAALCGAVLVYKPQRMVLLPSGRVVSAAVLFYCSMLHKAASTCRVVIAGLISFQTALLGTLSNRAGNAALSCSTSVKTCNSPYIWACILGCGSAATCKVPAATYRHT